MELVHHTLATLAEQPTADSCGMSLYALIDHGAVPDLIKQLDRYGVYWHSLFKGSKDEGALQVAPILVPLFHGDRELLPKSLIVWLFDECRYTSSLQFLLSPLEALQLSRRLAMRLDASLPDRVDIVLRYFDGRTFESLMAVLDDDQKRAFLGATAQWSIVDRQGEVRRYEAEFLDDDGELVPLEFSTAQEKALLELSEPDQVAMLLQTVVPTEYQGLPPVTRFGFLTRHIAAARSYGIDTVQAQALYCSLALTSGERFAEQPVWQEALGEVAARRMTMFDAVEQSV